MVCLPIGPRCDTCVLSSKGLCPSARAGPKRKAAAGRGSQKKGSAKHEVTEITIDSLTTKQEKAIKGEHLGESSSGPDLGGPALEIKLEMEELSPSH